MSQRVDSSEITLDDPVDLDSTEQEGRSRTEEILRDFHEESAIGKSYDTRLLLRLWPFVRPYRGVLTLSLAVVVVTAFTTLAHPLIMLHTIDEGVLAGNATVLFQGGVALVAILVFEQVLSFIQMYTMQVVGARSMADLRQHVFTFLHRMKVAYFDNQPVGRLVTRVTNDVDAILELFASGALNAFGDLIRLVGIVALMLALDWKLSLIGFAAAPPVALLVLFVRKRLRTAYRDIRAKTARMNATMNEQVNGMTVVQAFGREDAAAGEFDEINLAYRDTYMRSLKFEAIQDAAIDMVGAVCLASIIVSLGYREATFGTIVAFNAYLLKFFEPITALAQRYTILQSAMAGAERVFGLLDTTALDAEPGKAEPATDADVALAFENVGFEYKPGVPVLRNVSFRAKKGERIALVGPTGAGKTTVASLFLRLYDAQHGVVRVQGEDVRGLERENLRRRFAMVPQDVFLFPGTVASNIAAGEEPDRKRVEETLHRTGAWDLITAREGGIDAPVDEHGANFSAGERQLIAFARALYRDAPILVLDEATASVDSDTEARLQRAVEEVLKGRTSLIIAHRLSTIRAADRIVVFHKGRIVEQGTHDELLSAGGLYSRLHELQFSKEAS